jgi:hypothetical protein
MFVAIIHAAEPGITYAKHRSATSVAAPVRDIRLRAVRRRSQSLRTASSVPMRSPNLDGGAGGFFSWCAAGLFTQTL